METKANYVAVGAFVLACVLGLVIAVLWLAGAQYSQEYAYYQTYFNGPVTGLGEGTTVRYNGIEVGRVKDLQFDPNDPQKVIVTLQVRPNLNIREDATASIASEGLTGGTYVLITGGTAQAPLLVVKPGQRYPVIRTKASTLQQIEESAPQLIARLNSIAARLNDVLNDKNRRAIADTLSGLNKLTTTLANRSGDIDATLANLSKSTKALEPTLASADVTLKKFGKLSDDADSFVRGDALNELSGLIAETRRLVNSLTQLSNSLNHEPTKILFGDRRKGYTPNESK